MSEAIDNDDFYCNRCGGELEDGFCACMNTKPSAPVESPTADLGSDLDYQWPDPKPSPTFAYSPDTAIATETAPEIETEPYIVVANGDNACAHCNSGTLWDVLCVPEDVRLGTSYGLQEDAEEIAELMNLAFKNGESRMKDELFTQQDINAAYAAGASKPAAPPADKPTLDSPKYEDEIYYMLECLNKPGQISESTVAILWPLLVELVERRKG